MMEGRRHSVDVPLSTALIALRRVRSLRDPSTISLSKLSPPVEHTNYEKNFDTPDFFYTVNGSRESNCNSINSGLGRSRLCREEPHMSDDELYSDSRRYLNLVSRATLGGLVEKTGMALPRSMCVDGLEIGCMNGNVGCKNTALSERYCKTNTDRGLEISCETPCTDREETGVSSHEPDEGSKRTEKRGFGGSKMKIWHRRRDRWFKDKGGDDIMNQTGRQCLPVNDDLSQDVSSYDMSLDGNEGFGTMQFDTHGCGIGSCWSRTVKLGESNPFRGEDERPLLRKDVSQLLMKVDKLDSKHCGQAIGSYLESPRNICQKFMPKSFNELVGQNFVTMSLLNAISRGQIVSSYIFHGPRGTGKTSASRIFAAALNCLSTQVEKPCGLCRSCILFYSGRSNNVKEVDSAKINTLEKSRLLIKDAMFLPTFSRFKVYIIDDCHLLQREIWTTLLNKIEETPRNVVFIFITPDLDKLPQNTVSKAQRYHFQGVKDTEIHARLEKICAVEGIEYDLDALCFIATKSNGSLRDAEMMLDQMSLLGKKITRSLVYEMSGVVSEDELLDLLYLALSSDASNTVKKARELMRSRIDPLQLVSQLANLIMDILSGKNLAGVSEFRRKLFAMHASEADVQQLSHALKILSETEKQLRMSKNQTTWLTAALLQLSSSCDNDDPRLSMKTSRQQGENQWQCTNGDSQTTLSAGERLKHPIATSHENCESESGVETLELIWKRATGMCHPSSLKNFLQKRGKLASVHFTQGVAVAELEFSHPKYVRKTEKSWKMIASVFQHLLGYNVELRINLADNHSNKYVKFKKTSFCMFSCPCRVHLLSQLSAESGHNSSENSSSIAVHVPGDKCYEMCTPECRIQASDPIYCEKEMVKTVRNSDGNALSIGVKLPDNTARKNRLESSPLDKEINIECLNPVKLKTENLPLTRKFWKLQCWRSANSALRKVWLLRNGM